MKENAVIIMAKAPKIGYTKSRLTPPLSARQATNLYEALLQDTVSLVSNIEAVDLAVAVTPPDDIYYFERICPEGTILIPVECDDIGECLSIVLGKLLEMGFTKAFALNADSPSLPPEFIEDAVKQLSSHDTVIGPSTDGGYYLIGMNQFHGDLFSGINWSTNTVFEETLSKIENLNLKTGILAPWYDIDTIENIEQLQLDLKKLPEDQLINTRRTLKTIFTE